MIRRIFLDHPRAVNETYLEHMAFAAWFAARLFGAACAATVHAFIPCLFERTASRSVAELYECTSRRSDPNASSVLRTQN